MSEHEEPRPYAGPGDETSPREDLPADVEDVAQYVEDVDEAAPDESLEKRVGDQLGGRATGDPDAAS